MMTLGEKIRILRRNNEMSQAALAGRLCVSEDAVQKWETNRNTPNIYDLLNITKLFSTDMNTLTGENTEYVEITAEEVKPSCFIKHCYGDSDHVILDADLKKGAKLHRFINRGGVPYSAIYIGSYEAFSCEREREAAMIAYWQSEDNVY